MRLSHANSSTLNRALEASARSQKKKGEQGSWLGQGRQLQSGAGGLTRQMTTMMRMHTRKINEGWRQLSCEL
jgi:hypothetical protein